MIFSNDIMICFDDLMICSNDLMICLDDLMICLNDLMICLNDLMICLDDLMICLDDLKIGSDNLMLCLGDLVDLMIWVYVEDIDQFIDTHLWETYSQAFPRIWAAGAFKGNNQGRTQGFFQGGLTFYHRFYRSRGARPP